MLCHLPVASLTQRYQSCIWLQRAPIKKYSSHPCGWYTITLVQIKICRLLKVLQILITEQYLKYQFLVRFFLLFILSVLPSSRSFCNLNDSTGLSSKNIYWLASYLTGLWDSKPRVSPFHDNYQIYKYAVPLFD
jgi:hypothetical protein